MARGVLLALLSSCALSKSATTAAAKQAPAPPIPIFQISMDIDPDLPSIPWGKDDPDPAQFAKCTGDGNLYLWHLTVGIIGLTHSGLLSLTPDKITDVPLPRIITWSVARGKLYLSVLGTENAMTETQVVKDDDGREQRIQHTRGEEHKYIATFDADGTYRGAAKLDLPFDVISFAAFTSGNFVAQGLDQAKIPRIALLDSSTQMQRYLDLPKDISAVRAMSERDFKLGGDESGNIGVIAMFSSFTPANGNMLFMRSLSSTRIYEIQESGAVRFVTVKAPDGYNLEGIIPSDRNWLVNFRKPAPRASWSDAEHVVFEVDPESGKLLREYRIKSPDTSIACYFDGEFWSIRREDDKAKAVRGTARPYPGK